MYTKYKIVPFCPYHFVHTILSNTSLSVYHFVHTILSVPFCPRPFCPVTIEIEFVQGTFVRDFCTRPTKKRGAGVPICVTYFWGVPGCVTKCDRGRGVKIGQK